MSLLDKVSLCVTPNAYKASKLYSVVPNTTLGDMTVVRATTATRVNSLGLIESVAVNIPRIDYTNGSCPSLLVEGQRTNLFLRSEQFTNASWIYSGGGASVFTDNFSISPSGNTTASRWTAANINSQVRQNVATINTTGTISVWMRTNSGTKNVTLFINDIAVQSTVTVNTTWQRFTLTGATGVILLGAGRCGFSNNSVLTTSDYIEVWGAQYEVGSYATSYIPTVASTVTRNADTISKTGISSLIDSQQGVLFADLQFLTGIGGIRSINISNGSNNNRIGFYGHPSIADRITFAISSGGVTTDINYDGVILTNRNKVLIRYSGTTFTSFVNGVKSANQTFTPFAANFLNRIGLDYGEDILKYEGRINSIQLYKTALTDTECINLTTL